MRSRIFICGSANIDLTFRLDCAPCPGVTHVCSEYQMGFGGKGANQAVAAARLGADVTFLGKVGADAFGPAIREQLRAEGVRTDHVTVAKLPTGTAVILLDRTGQNTILTHAGPNVHLTVEDVRRARADIEAASIVLATLETPGPALLELFSIARAAGATTILNPAPPVTFPHELLKLADICVPNESELAALTGSTLALEDAIRQLRAMGPANVILTLGERGAMLSDLTGTVAIPGIPVTAIDTTGAGDAFCAGLAVSLAEGKPLRTAVDRANRAAAISVTRSGTQTSFPTRREVG